MLHRLYFAKRKPGTGLTPFYYWESYQVASQNPGVCSSRYRAGWIIGRYRMDKVRLIYYGTYLSMTHEYWSLSLVHPFNGELFLSMLERRLGPAKSERPGPFAVQWRSAAPRVQ
jgi:hypothetical protein